MPIDPFDLADDAPSLQPRAAAPRWLDGLNPEQREAVETTEGALLVLSGAGTGKTRVLTTRLAHIVVTGRARPWQVLAVTFTNKAAREMRERVAGLVGPAAEQVWLGTFHALGARMLRRHAPLVGLQSNFTILDTDDQLRLLKQVMTDEGTDIKKSPAPAVMGTIQRWKDRGRTPDKMQPADGGTLADGRLVDIYRRYQERLRTLNACDFGDLLLHCLTIFQDPTHAAILADYQQQFRYILVDEYQDTNVAQYLWLRLLTATQRNICCVGDDDQAIYSWRGAEVENILRFESDFPGAKVIRLEANYRSTPAILAAASGLIGHNQGRLGKTLRPGANGGEEGERIVVCGLANGTDEARWVADEIAAQQRVGISLDHQAILVRAGFQTREFEERLVTTGLPYRVVGGVRFYERQEVRDALAYFRVVVQPADDLAFERIVNLPKRGLGGASLQAMHVAARSQSVPLTEAAASLAASDALKPKARAALAGLLGDFERWRSLLGTVSHLDLAARIIEESGYADMWRADKAPDAPGRLENLKELVAALREFDGLTSFLEHVSLVMENDEAAGEHIQIMTLHSAKGLEFDVVYLPGWEEGLFPHQRSLEERDAKRLEEERRLAYVGLTRARRRVFVSHAEWRRVYNQWQFSVPSRFIDELPAEWVDCIGAHAPAAAAPSARPETLAAAAPRPAAAGEVPDGGFKPGNRVFHQMFGYGLVLSVDGDRLQVSFERAGIKKMIDRFLRLA
jgi:DNA helicase-2/ATP-dependent DNA helicase PcrA